MVDIKKSNALYCSIPKCLLTPKLKITLGNFKLAYNILIEILKGPWRCCGCLELLYSLHRERRLFRLVI